MEAVLRTNKLCKSFFSGGVKQAVLRDMDLEIFQGDFTVIMGASGSGKSTLLYALSGMDTPSSGDIFYPSAPDAGGRKYSKGRNIAKLSQDELADFRTNNCGFVFQQIYLVDSLSIFDNALLSGLLKSKDKKAVKAKAKELFVSVGLDEACIKKFPSQVSGGEAQRAAVVRAAVNDPKILFADEPTGALDSQNSKAVLDVLTEINRRGQSVVMVTHDILSAVRASRILFLKDGRLEGELKLQPYSGEDEARRTAVKDFLTGLGW